MSMVFIVYFMENAEGSGGGARGYRFLGKMENPGRWEGP